jgi:hypothetical protein
VARQRRQSDPQRIEAASQLDAGELFPGLVIELQEILLV